MQLFLFMDMFKTYQNHVYLLLIACEYFTENICIINIITQKLLAHISSKYLHICALRLPIQNTSNISSANILL